ncbi:unnamed protein product [Peronospora destructor]|nr:unnamed protein product [Peronospora destructor]
MVDYEHVLASSSGLPSATRWKPVRRKYNVIVYQDQLAVEVKRQKRKTKSLGDILSRSETPKMIWMGTIECALDDLMYGLGSQSDEVTRINSSYSGNNIQDFATLALLEEATPSDSFHSLQLKWEVNSALTKAKPLWRSRDFVYLKATGVTVSRSAGQRIGYQILHSLDVRGVPELPGRKLTRGRLTVYQLFRQKSKGTVEVFAKGMVDLAGDIPAAMASFATIEAANSVNAAAKCARKRKLNWLLFTAATNCPNYAAADRNDSCCSVCARNLRNAFGQKICFDCRICTERVCYRCHVRQELSFIKPDKTSFVVNQRSIDLCTRCVHTATQTNARRVALEERALENPVSMYKYIPREKHLLLKKVPCDEEFDISTATEEDTENPTHTAVLLDRVTEVLHRLF